MAITVGTNTYLSLSDADAYWSDRNNSTWSAAEDADKEKALREATQYIDGAYEFIGEITVITQTLAWPRAGAEVLHGNLKGVYYNNTVIPPQVESACAELALEALSTRLREAQERGGRIKREKVDTLEVEYTDFAPANKTYEFVTMLLKPVLRNSGSNQINLKRS